MITDVHRDSLDEIQLHESISIPSKVHVYSLGVEYMRDWFISKFEDHYGADFLKTIYINGKHIFDDYRRFNKTQLTKIEKPAVAIVPTVEHDYNRDTVDLRLGGLDVLTRRSRFQQNDIIQDYDNNYFLRMIMEAVRINFSFRLRLSTRAQQLDIGNFMKFAFRVGSTQKAFVDYDYHLPYEVMLNMAEHNNFEIIYPSEENKDIFYPKIKDIAGFLHYLNSHSMYPISYKMRTVSGNCEFFMRMPELCTHISNLDQLSLDDGEREDQLDNNFHIEMNSILTIPAPQEYFFYSSEALRQKFKVQQDTAGLYLFRPLSPPNKDSHGWRQFLSTEYVDEDNVVEEIDLTELLVGSELEKAIQATKNMHISPSVFVNVILFNSQYERKTRMDWERNTLIMLDSSYMKSDYSQITIYVDLEYMNNQLHIINSISDNRIKKQGGQLNAKQN